jgi:hypothetical protein
MNILKHFTSRIAVTLASGMVLAAATGGALAFTPTSRDVVDQRLSTVYTNLGVAVIKKKPATPAVVAPPAVPPGSNSTNVNARDHRKPEGSQTASAPPAGTPTAKPPVPTVTEIRDHRPGGNADPCLKPHNTCNASARNTSIVEFRKQRPDVIGLDGDPCFQTNSCNRSQLIESLIARAQKNLDRGSCDSRIAGQGCAQKTILPSGTEIVLRYQHNGGPLLEADRQHLLATLQEAYDKSLGGGSIQAPSANTAHRQN